MLKESFEHFWICRSLGRSMGFLDAWVSRALRSRLESTKKGPGSSTRTGKRSSTTSNTASPTRRAKGSNSRIQAIKSAARGFRSSASYRMRILFHCGRLDLKPAVAHY
ncbi:MAG: transposase [Verrucomicrobiaceae bacterium]|nr:transposase [Verrucomicrobiaceae bacterium]